MPEAGFRIAVLFSGRGTNLQALIDQQSTLGYQVVLGLCNRPRAGGIAICSRHQIDCRIITSVDQAQAESRILAALQDARPDLLVLAGYMRILSASFLARCQGRIINIHPSLLPRYPGLDTHQRALDAGDLEHGCTVHQVIPALDAGQAIAQSALDILPGDTAASLAERLLRLEHQLLPAVVGGLARRSLQLQEEGVRWHDEPLQMPLDLHQLHADERAAQR